MSDALPLARNRKRIMVMVALVAVMVISAVGFTTAEIYMAALQDKRAEVAANLALIGNLLNEASLHDQGQFAKSLLSSYQAVINRLPLGALEFGIVGQRNGKLVVYLWGRRDPHAQRHPEKFHLLDEKGEPRYMPQGSVFEPLVSKALAGRTGIERVETPKRGEYMLGYAPVKIMHLRLALVSGFPLGPLQSAMIKQGLVLLVLTLIFIAVCVWVFLRLNPMLAELTRSQEAAIQMLGEASHYKDTDTGWHVERMADYTVAIARAMDLPPGEVRMLRLAARMHDLGKVGTPDAILKKPGKLDSDEWVVMREHSSVGAKIMEEGDTPVFAMAREVAEGHHEKWDGSGYALGRAGEDIPLVARITAVADVFDALTMRRPYKDPWPVDKAFATIQKDAGSHFDPAVVEAFMGIKREILEIKAYWEQQEKAAREDRADRPAPPA